MTLAILLAVLLAGCTSSAIPGLTPIGAESRYGVLQTEQRCSNAPLLRGAADRMLPLIVDELDRAKLVEYAHLVDRLRDLHQSRLWICLLPKPEPCPRGSTVIAAGCADSMAGTTLWVAHTSTWEAALAHEFGHVLSIRGGYYAAGSGHPPAVFGPGGVVERALKRYHAQDAAK
jgi:hypothetical protein